MMPRQPKIYFRWFDAQIVRDEVGHGAYDGGNLSFRF